MTHSSIENSHSNSSAVVDYNKVIGLVTEAPGGSKFSEYYLFVSNYGEVESELVELGVSDLALTSETPVGMELYSGHDNPATKQIGDTFSIEARRGIYHYTVQSIETIDEFKNRNRNHSRIRKNN